MNRFIIIVLNKKRSDPLCKEEEEAMAHLSFILCGLESSDLFLLTQEVCVTSRGLPSAPDRHGSPPRVWDRGWGWCTRCANRRRSLRRPAGAGSGLGSDPRTETQEGRRSGTETGHAASYGPPQGDRSSESSRWPESISEETQEDAFTSTQRCYTFVE